MSCHVAVFDLDGTLTRRDTSLPFLAQAGGRWRTLLGIAEAAAWSGPDLWRSAQAERGPRGEAVGGVYGRWEGLLHQRVVARALKGRSREEIDVRARAFAARVIGGHLRPGVRAGLAAHSDRGHRLVLASASLEAYLRPLGAALAFDGVVGTRLEWRDGVATGRFAGLPCWGAEKLRRVRSLVADWGDVTLHAYGDSAGDGALLAAADHAHRIR